MIILNLKNSYYIDVYNDNSTDQLCCARRVVERELSPFIHYVSILPESFQQCLLESTYHAQIMCMICLLLKTNIISDLEN